MRLPSDISLVELTASDALLGEAETLLSEDERARYRSFRHVGRQRSFLLGRLAARRAVAEREGVDPSDVGLAIRDDGSVSVVDHALDLSISHSGAYAAAALATGPVGVDLERIKPRPESLFRFFLHPDEGDLRESLDLRDDVALVLMWSLKEAVLKGKRTGLRLSPKSLKLSIDMDRGSAVITGRRVWHGAFRLSGDHVLSVVWPAEHA